MGCTLWNVGTVPIIFILYWSWNEVIWYRIVLYCTYRMVSYRMVSHGIVQYNMVSCRRRVCCMVPVRLWLFKQLSWGSTVFSAPASGVTGTDGRA